MEPFEPLSYEERAELEECINHIPKSMMGVVQAIDVLLTRFRCAPYTQEQVDEAIVSLEKGVEECVPVQSFIILQSDKYLTSARQLKKELGDV